MVLCAHPQSYSLRSFPDQGSRAGLIEGHGWARSTVRLSERWKDRTDLEWSRCRVHVRHCGLRMEWEDRVRREG
jgi:hypothetical protein